MLTYNVRGMKMTSGDPDMGNWTYGYYPLGELKSQTDAKNQTVTFTYDALSRPSARIEPEGTTNWFWDTATHGIGRLHSVNSPGGYSESYSYDNYGRMQTQSVLGSYMYTYGYHPTEGTLQTLEYPASIGTPFKVQYDYAYGQMLRVKEYYTPSTVFWQANATNARGQIVDEQFGNGLRTISGYDRIAGWLDDRTTGPGSGSTVQDLAYTYSKLGNLTQRQDLNQGITETFYYDDLDRLDYSQRNGLTNLDLTYDAIGNIAWKSDIGAYAYHATKKHAVVSTTGASNNSYGYDPNGNMVTRNSATTTWYSYNLPNTISGASSSSTFSYGVDRQRWRQIAVDGGTTELWTYPGKLMEKRQTPSLTEYRHYIIGQNGPVASHRRVSSGASNMVYLHGDHLGSTDVITVASGAVFVQESFDAFGKRRGSNWSGNPTATDYAKFKASTPRGFTSHEHLDNLSLIHMNGRVYDPVIGRSISADPFVQAPYNSQSLNRYSYVMNNPLSFVDPSGFATDCAPADNSGDWCVTSGYGGPNNFDDYFVFVDVFDDSAIGMGFDVLDTAGLLGTPGGGTGGNESVSTVGGTIGPYTPLFRDNFAGHVLASFDNLAGLVASPFRDGPTRGLFSNIVLTPRELQDTKLSLVVSAVGPLIGGAANGTKAIAAGATTSTAELIPTHGMTMSRRAFEALKQDISLNGIKSPINFVEANGRKYVLDGHHRVRAARELGIEQVPTEQVQLPFLGYKTLDDLFSGF